jgi:AraC family transcriptional regulator
MSKPADALPALITAAGLDDYMPMPPVNTSTEMFPECASMRACLYRLSPGAVTIPPVDSLRVVVQLSAKCMTLERDLGGVTSATHPCLDSININPAYQSIHWQWDSFMEIVQIQLPKDFITKIAPEYGLDAERLLRLERLNIHDGLIAQIGREISAILEGTHHGADVTYLDALATFLGLHLARHYCQGVPQAHIDQRDMDLSRVVEYIHQNLGRDLRIEQIAKMVNLSNFYFIRQFKAALGKTPHQYILDCRIQLAKDLLCNSFLPINDISQRCGFSTQSHFTSSFRQNTGTSPRAFRHHQPKADIALQ